MFIKAVRVSVKSVKVHVKAIRVLVETVRVIISPTASTTLSQPFESSSELSITSQESACRLQRP